MPDFYLAASSLSLCLQPFVSFSCLVTQMVVHKRTATVLRSGKWRPYELPWIVPLPLLLLVGHGNLTNNGNDWRDGAARRRTGNREQEIVSSRREKRSDRAQTERRLWSSCRNYGMKTWMPAMQLKVKANWVFGGCNWKAFNNNLEKKHTHLHVRTPLPTQLVVMIKYGLANMQRIECLRGPRRSSSVQLYWRLCDQTCPVLHMLFVFIISVLCFISLAFTGPWLIYRLINRLLLSCHPQSDHMHSHSTLKVNSCLALMSLHAPCHNTEASLQAPAVKSVLLAACMYL